VKRNLIRLDVELVLAPHETADDLAAWVSRALQDKGFVPPLDVRVVYDSSHDPNWVGRS
jgi:hypothetical protein